MKKILCIVGTRPEAIKMAPVINALRHEIAFSVRILVTAQHRDMLDQVMEVFGIKPDLDMNLMQPNQSLTMLTSRLFSGFDAIFSSEKPDAILAQGDTTTVMSAAIASFYQKIPFGHIEAGLRTGDLNNPFPEELNRIIAGKIATWHFAPTQSSRENLVKEGIPDKNIVVTGNTVIDALLSVLDSCGEEEIALDSSKRLILVTAHRRENYGDSLEDICEAIKIIVDRNEDIQILFPVHPNPNIKSIVYKHLDGISRIYLCEPLEYLPFVAAMKKAYLILTDSGGVQEEAPALGKPVLVMRNETERPEAISEGVVKLVGTEKNNIVKNVQLLLDDKNAYRNMAKGVSPYGDGNASARIIGVLKSYFF